MDFDLKKLAFVDLETTGCSPLTDRVIDIGVVLIDDGQVVEEWETLLNPQITLPPMIEKVTGIKQRDLIDAPSFDEIYEDLLIKLEGRVFVAHNSAFDYGFLRQEFLRVREKIALPQLCTVRLSKRLFPEDQSHSLDALMKKFSISCEARHRALPDAKVTWEFFSRLDSVLEKKKVGEEVEKLIKFPSLPSQVDSQKFSDIYEGPGLYFLWGVEVKPLFIGKSNNLRERVLQHFHTDTGSVRDVKLRDRLQDIEVITTAGELDSIMRYVDLVRKYKPEMNKRIKMDNKICEVDVVWEGDKVVDILYGEEREYDISEIKFFKYVFGNKAHASRVLNKLIEEKSGYDLKKALRKFQLKRWPYRGVVLLPEYNIETDQSVVHLIDRWCYLGAFESEDEISEKLKTQNSKLKTIGNNNGEMKLFKDRASSPAVVFDLEKYRQLSGYLLNPFRNLDVKVVGKKY